MGKIARTVKSKFPSIIKLFENFDGSKGSWEVWNDFIYLSAISISNTLDGCIDRKKSRERDYQSIVSKYNKTDLTTFSKIFAEIVDNFEENANQDLLGELYMALEFGNSNLGQFFTPYNVCKLMAETQFDEELTKSQIKQNGFIRVNEPSCGAGANIIAYANELKKHGINYQQSVYFVAQDLSQLTALMCYIQMSLLGMPGIVVVGDTLAKPYTKGNYDIDTSNQVWITPMFQNDIWQFRKVIRNDF